MNDSYRIASDGAATENDMPAMEGITTLSENDIILGRGGVALKHQGNAAYRSLVARNSELYATCQKTEKLKQDMVARDEEGNPITWRDVGDKRALEKTSQALREKQPQLLKKLGGMKPIGQEAFDITKISQILREMRKGGRKEAESSGTIGQGRATLREKQPQLLKKLGMKTIGQEASAVPLAGANILPAQHSMSDAAPIYVPVVVPVIPIALESLNTSGSDRPQPVALTTKISDTTIPLLGVGEAVEEDGPPGIVPEAADVLLGRGEKRLCHPGNVRYRDLVGRYRDVYEAVPKADKLKVARLVLRVLRSADPPSRFLRKNDAGAWEEVSDEIAITTKISQALREKRNGGGRDSTSYETEEADSSDTREVRAVRSAMSPAVPSSMAAIPDELVDNLQTKGRWREQRRQRRNKRAMADGTELSGNSRKRRCKDPNAPKAPSGSYVFFTLDVRPEIVRKHPHLKFTDVGRVMGERWRALSADEKRKYEDLANADKKRFDAEMEAYNASKPEPELVQTPKSDRVISKQEVVQAAPQAPNTALQTMSYLDLKISVRLNVKEWMKAKRSKRSK
ncbi:hypothetical protein ACHAXT_012844 [Thalassiosira profunda]